MLLSVHEEIGYTFVLQWVRIVSTMEESTLAHLCNFKVLEPYMFSILNVEMKVS